MTVSCRRPVVNWVCCSMQPKVHSAPRRLHTATQPGKHTIRGFKISTGAPKPQCCAITWQWTEVIVGWKSIQCLVIFIQPYSLANTPSEVLNIHWGSTPTPPVFTGDPCPLPCHTRATSLLFNKWHTYKWHNDQITQQNNKSLLTFTEMPWNFQWKFKWKFPCNFHASKISWNFTSLHTWHK